MRYCLFVCLLVFVDNSCNRFRYFCCTCLPLGRYHMSSIWVPAQGQAGTTKITKSKAKIVGSIYHWANTLTTFTLSSSRQPKFPELLKERYLENWESNPESLDVKLKCYLGAWRPTSFRLVKFISFVMVVFCRTWLTVKCYMGSIEIIKQLLSTN